MSRHRCPPFSSLRLHTHAHTKEGTAAGDVAPDRLDQAAPLKVMHDVRRRAHAGHDQGGRAVERAGIIGHQRPAAGPLHRTGDVTEIAGAVVDDHNSGHNAEMIARPPARRQITDSPTTRADHDSEAARRPRHLPGAPILRGNC
jgi:hypothetical protein